MNYKIDDIIKNIKLRQKLFPCQELDLPNEICDAFEFFIDALISAHKSVNTILSYYYDLKTFFDFIKENYQRVEEINQINTIMISRFYKYLETTKQNSHTSIKRKKLALRLFFDYMLEQNILYTGKNPMPKEGIIKSKNTAYNKTRTYLDEEEIDYFMNELLKERRMDLYKYRNISMFALMINAGLRISEVLSIDIKDIKNLFENKMLTIMGKGSKERIIPLSDIYIDNTYLKYIRIYFNLRMKLNIEDDAFFVSKNKKRVTSRNFQNITKNYREKLNLDKKITPHKLRHTFATSLIKKDIDIRKVQELLGHSSISTTQIYTHINNKDLEETLNKTLDKNKIQ